MRQPTSSEVTKAPKGSSMLEVSASKLSNSVLPKKPMGHGPMESALNMPMTQQKAVTMHAALRRVVFSSSDSSEVPISCMEMVEVRAARVRRAKKTIDTT